MRRNTLILPADDPDLAADLLKDAIADLDVILMLVFGADEVADTVARSADRLANKTRLEPIGNLRHVVWVHDPDALEARAEFEELFARIREQTGGQLPLVAVLNFHDQVRGTIRRGEPTNPTALDIMFLRGQLR